MAPIPRQRSRQVSVEQLLLRTTGRNAVLDGAIKHRLRPEPRAGANTLRLSVGVAAVVAVGCLTAFAATSKPRLPEPASLSLQPVIPEWSPTTFSGSAPAPAPTSPEPARPPSTSQIPSAPASPVPDSKPHRSASPRPVSAAPAPPAASCAVRFTITDSWPGGFTASVAITNNGGSRLSPWTLTWTFTAGQQITHGWDGEYSQAGGQVTVHPASYNPAIAPSATISIGFNGSYASANPSPTGFALNGTHCAATYQR